MTAALLDDLARVFYEGFAGQKANAGRTDLPKWESLAGKQRAVWREAASRWAEKGAAEFAAAALEDALAEELEGFFSACSGKECAACEQRNECGDRRLRGIYAAWRTAKKETKR